MATAYTPILKLALPVTGELNGTWGDVVNQNITEMVEQAVAGLATINTWTANSHTLTTANGTTSESRCAMLVIDDDGAGNPSAAATVICPAATKPYIVQNICGQTVTVKTAAGTGVAIPNNQSALVFCNGTNVVTGAFNGDVVGPASATDNAIVRYDGATGKLIQNSAVTIDDSNNVSGVVQLNATTVAATTGNITTVNATTVDTTNLEVTNLKAKDGTAAGSIANSTGVVTLASSVLTTTDINGGTIDATTIGASTPSTVVATQVDITAQGDLRLQDTTGGQFVALQAPGTIATSYTLTLPVDDGTSGQALITDGSGVLSWSSAASGDVYGPASATDNAVARYDGTTGKIIQNSAVTIADDGATVIAANSTSDGLRITQTGTGNALLVEDSANPDATPTLIDSVGRLVLGTTSALTMAGTTPPLQLQAASSSMQQALVSWGTNTAHRGDLQFMRSASGIIGTQGAVLSGYDLGALNFYGDDGTAFIQAAQILAEVDGTPGTNDMPGRLVFSTTADGASSPTERMRIDAAGNVGIGGAAIAGSTVYIPKNATGAANTSGFRATQTIQSDSTTSYSGFISVSATAPAAFTLSSLYHMRALQGTIGATSAVTNQFGFHVDSSLTGAANNYGFYSNIASGTGRWNFYANGTAENFFGGATTISTSSTSDALRITQTGTGNALLVEDSANPDATPVVIDNSGYLVVGHTGRLTTTNTGQIQSVVTSAGNAFNAVRFSSTTGGSEFNFAKSDSDTIGTNTVVANNDTIGNISFSGADGTNYIRAAQIFAAVDGTPGTNDMPGRLVFSTTADGASSPTERMRIGSTGVVAIGATVTAGGASGCSIRFGNNLTGATNPQSILGTPTVLSDATAGATIYASIPTTQAASFTCAALSHYVAAQGTFGAGSTVTSQFGYSANASLVGATNNYGFYSNIASGTGRWNFYAAGSAANYFAGDMQLDKTVTAGGTTGAQTINKNAGTVNFAAAATSLVVTDSRVTTSSIIICTVGTNDTTLKSVAAVAGAGSFTLHANAAATAETRVNFLIIN